MVIKKIGKLLLALCLPLICFAQDISIEAKVNKTSLVFGDYLEYRIEISGTNRFNSNAIKLPNIPNFQMMNSTPATSMNTSIINGRKSEKTILSYYLKPQKVGKLIIPNFSLRHNNKNYTLNAISIEVVKSDGEVKEVRYVFIKQEINTRSPYQYQEVTVKYKLYVHPQVGVDNISLASTPSNTGVWKETYELNGVQQIPSEVVDNIQYKVYLVSKEAMFPTISGTITIKAPEFKLGISRVDRHNSRQGNSIFENFFGSRRIHETVSAKPNENTLNVKSFTGPNSEKIGFSGSLKMNVDISKTNVKTNDAIDLTITLSGSGNIQALEIPDFYISPDIEKYEPNLRSKINKDGNLINGYKKIEYALVPRVAGVQNIGPFEYTYWDTSEKKAKTLRSEIIQVNVEQGKSFISANNSGSVAAKRDVMQLDQDIRYIRDNSDSFVDISYVLIDSPSYFIYFGLVIILFIVIQLYLNYKLNIDSNSTLKRKKEASSKAVKFLKQAELLKNETNHAEFFSTVKKLLLHYIADKTNSNQAGFTSEILKETLLKRNIEIQTISELNELLDKCDFYQYSNPDNVVAEMDDIYNAASDLYLKISMVI